MKFFEVEIPEEPLDGVEFIWDIRVRKDPISPSSGQHATAHRGAFALVRRTADVSTAQFPRHALSSAAVVAAVVTDDDFVTDAQAIQVTEQEGDVPLQ